MGWDQQCFTTGCDDPALLKEATKKKLIFWDFSLNVLAPGVCGHAKYAVHSLQNMQKFY